MKPKKSHNLPTASWRIGKESTGIVSKLENQGVGGVSLNPKV